MTISNAAIIAWMESFAALIAVNKDYLTELDSSIGDADHGVNMNRGMQVVVTKLPSVADKDIGTIFKTVGMTLISTVGGASGPLYGTFFIQMSTVSANKLELDQADLVAAFDAARTGLLTRGKAQLGDKTMLDAFSPAVDAMRESLADHVSTHDLLAIGVKAAEEGRDATIPMVAHKGRASYLGERSANHQDPGATSVHLLLQAAEQTLGEAS